MTIHAGIAGWPVAHSRSPLIHGAWLAGFGIDGSYERLPVPPEEAEVFFSTLGERGLAGCNVTVPLKEIAFRAAAEADPVARALGAANTLWLEDGVLHAANTDVFGFLANLDQRAPGWDADPGAALVLGAGGAARGIVYALAARGFAPITIANRTRARAEEVARLDPARVRVADWMELPARLVEAGLLVNTTSLGMAGQPPLALDLAPLPGTALVTDIVYVPLVTPLLAAAAARGLRTVDGLGMLLHQAVPGFERWFGRRPAVTEALRARVIADIEGRP